MDSSRRHDGLQLHGPIRFTEEQIAKIDLIIVGGESGGREATSFDINWIHHIEKQVKGTNCKLFVKQLGSYPYEGSRGYGLQPQFVTLRDSHGGDWNEWPDDLRRREFPSVAPCSDT